jgi:N-acetylneuraminate synthase
MRVGPRSFSTRSRCFVISEIGSNHAGSKELALRLIDISANCGAQAVKFQLWKPEDISYVPERVDGKFGDITPWIPDLFERAHKHKMSFICTPFAPWAVGALWDHVDAWKIASFESLTNLMHLISKDHLRLKIVSLGQVDENQRRALMRRWTRNRGWAWLHCVSRYPTRDAEAALWRCKAISDYRRPWGYSSHTDNWFDVTLAVAMGAKIVEKHIRLPANEQPDAPDNLDHALTPVKFDMMVRDIRRAEQMIQYGPNPLREFTPAPPDYGRKLHGERE